MQFSNESIWSSIIRTFCKTFAAILGLCFALALVTIVIGGLSGQTVIPPEKVEISLAPDAEGNRDLLPSTAPVILKIDFSGTIGEGDLKAENIEEILISSQEDPLQNHRVRGVFLYMNTPGGAASDSDEIYRALLKYKKKYNVPIYAFVEGLCASGGMMIAAAADKIYATPDSIVGSIGVILGPTFNFSGAMAKYGVESLTIAQGKDKDMLNPFRPWQQGEDGSLRVITEQLYDRFVDIMVTNRPQIDKTKLVQEYGAQVYLAEAAQKIGYVDGADSDYEASMQALVKAANIGAEERYQVVQLNTPPSFLATLIQSRFSLLKGKVTHVFQMGPISSEMSGKILYLYAPG